MQSLIEQMKNGGNLHHFCIIEGNRDAVIPELEIFCSKHLDFKTQGNRNYHQSHFDTLLVNDAKKLTDIQTRKQVGSDIAVFVITCNSITEEAQNALLKVMEEPTLGNHFFFILPYTNTLLPTIVSRAVLIKHNSVIESDFPSYKELVKTSLKDRMTLVTKIMGDIKKENLTKGDAQQFTLNLLRDMNEEFMSGKMELAGVLKDAQKSVKYINNKGASVKNILEHLMLLIPKE